MIAFGITNFLVSGLQELCKSWPRLRKVVDVGPVPQMAGMEPSDRTYVASVCVFSNPTIFTNIPKPIAIQTDNTSLLLKATLRVLSITENKCYGIIVILNFIMSLSGKAHAL